MSDTNKMFVDMARRAYEFAGMCCRMQKLPDITLTTEVKEELEEYAKRLGLNKEDPEAWRAKYLAKQSAGVKYDCMSPNGRWHKGGNWSFIDNKECYREVQQDDESWREECRKKQEAGVKFEYRSKARTGIWLTGFQAFDGNKEDYREVQQEEQWKPMDDTKYKIIFKPTIPHAKERALHWSQRAAGTNEVWIGESKVIGYKLEYSDKEPHWFEGWVYRVKTVKWYFALAQYGTMIDPKVNSPFAIRDTSETKLLEMVKKMGWVIIGNIESREVPVE